ncbi:hypothetical protein [Rhodanobacter sp. C01]|uniref:hypothetical protein n=1 Tax=Rhodanobacter sp. C01 TaxID=1945856 RepID=UPI00143B5930|nr:hypothetical protein [Rhodanobacter sp. C01]
MPLPPTDQPAAGPPASHPSRTILNSPRAAAARAAVYRRRRRERPHERGLRVAAAVGALLVHLVFLLSFVLGPAYEVKPPRESKEQFLHVRLIEAPEPPPPPLGTPPKELGPRHEGHAAQVASTSTHSTSTQAVAAARPVPVAASPVIAQAVKSSAPVSKPVASPPPSVSLPRPAPAPSLQPITQAGVPPAVSLPTPVLQPPVPPKFQPEPVRRPQLEGTRPLPPPPSLALPTPAVPAMPPITVSNIALNTTVPKSDAPASVTPARAEQPTAPPVPELQPITLPAQPLPTVNLQARLSVPAASVPRAQPKLQAAKIDVADPELAVVPPAPVAPAQVQVHVPAVKIENAQKTSASIMQVPVEPAPIERPQLNAPPVAAAVPSPSTANTPTESPAPAANAQPAVASSPGQAGTERDVSTAPNATPQGSDTAVPGEPNGVAAAPENQGSHANGPQPTQGKGSGKGVGGREPGPGQIGGNQPGAAEGTPQGSSEQGSAEGYVQLKPSGDTQIMQHGTPNIGYKPTRFDGDWTPADESSVDTALRHAVEKTTVAHTFHLPRGIRVECKVVPLLPMALLGCGNPDPPPAPVAAKVYDRLHLAPANPVATPTPSPAASTVAAAAPVRLDNSVQCAEARVAGGPPPPGCEGITLPVKRAHPAASSSTSWVPASDQFH